MDSFSISMSHPEVFPGRGWELAWGQFTVTKGALVSYQFNGQESSNLPFRPRY